MRLQLDELQRELRLQQQELDRLREALRELQRPSGAAGADAGAGASR